MCRKGSVSDFSGPNGAGKTTTLRMIYGAAQPSAGTVSVFGMKVAKCAREVRARLGVTLQDNVLIETATARENMQIFGRHYLLDADTVARRVDTLVEFLQLGSHADMIVRRLSGGFKRRLAIALSLMNMPELLILDEPTTGLDPNVRQGLWSRVRALRASGTTVLITTHYMDEAERLCDRVVIMARGRAIADDSPGALISTHLAREAIEFDCDEAEERRFLASLGNGVPHLRAGNRTMAFADGRKPPAGRAARSRRRRPQADRAPPGQSGGRVPLAQRNAARRGGLSWTSRSVMPGRSGAATRRSTGAPGSSRSSRISSSRSST